MTKTYSDLKNIRSAALAADTSAMDRRSAKLVSKVKNGTRSMVRSYANFSESAACRLGGAFDASNVGSMTLTEHDAALVEKWERDLEEALS